MGPRRGSIYDPARDLFTATENKGPDADGQDHGDKDAEPKVARNDLKRSRSPGTEEAIHQDDSPSRKRGAVDEEPSAKRARTSPQSAVGSTTELTQKQHGSIAAGSSAMPSLASIPRFKKAPGERNTHTSRQGASPRERRRSRSPRNDPFESRRRDRPTASAKRSQSPAAIPRSPSRSPPRPRKKPGGAARISTADRETIRQRQLEREKLQKEEVRAEAAARGINDVVLQHYNAVPQRGREWRRTDSKIKGLRSLNNWVKSAIIQKFSPSDGHTPGARAPGAGLADGNDRGLLVLDMGCGKGGDLQKWQSAPQKIDLYVGLDPADVSIDQASERYMEMKHRAVDAGGFRDRRQGIFDGRFIVKDCFGEWLGDVPIVQEVGIDGSVGPDGAGSSQRWGGGGFDVVSMMFCMHYAFESAEKARGMLRNVAGCLKKGGRFLGVIPNSDVLTEKVLEYNAHHKKADSSTAGAAPGVQENIDDGGDDDDWDPEKPAQKTEAKPSINVEQKDDEDDWDPEKPTETAGQDEPKSAVKPESNSYSVEETLPGLEWGNDIYRVKFPGKVPVDGVFRPPYGWKYFYFLEEAVEEIPEYVVPWEAFRAMADDYNLELQYREPFTEVWKAEKDDPILGPLSERMGVRGRNGGPPLFTDEEFDAAGFYHAFCFYKV